ncbi:MAG: hypothetical protein PHQ74_00780 [Crocinitomicaceae bacterium]|nr:hypothetical protein [Crocinitomicaceae bacterium]
MKITIFLLISLLLSSCMDSKKSTQTQTKIDLEKVTSIYIKKSRDGADSVRLNDKETELFVSEWNNAKSEGVKKMGVSFWFSINLQNDSIRRFRTNGNLIKEKQDWAYSISDSNLFSTFWKLPYLFDKPENYNPITFIKAISSTSQDEKSRAIVWITMNDEFPIDWIKEEHVDYLISILDSKEICKCFVNPLSSYLPFNDFAEKGGYARIFLQAYKENRKVELGLHSCPKVDEKMNATLRKWWKERGSR